jgi:hypothetical protein
MKLKYIIIQHAGMEVPLVFSRFLQHGDVAGTRKIESAGFCELDASGKWVVVGESTSLNLKVRPQDSEILNAHLMRRQFDFVNQLNNED